VDASHQPRPTRRLAALLAVLASAASLLIVAPGPLAQGDPPPNPSNGQINRAEATKAALADQVGKLSAQVADLQNQVQEREAAAELAEQKLADALQKLADAKAAVSAAHAQLRAAQAEVDKATKQFSDFVRTSYMGSPINGAAAGLLTAPDPNALLARNDYLGYSAQHRLDIIGTLSRAKVEQSNADAAARGAEQRQAAATEAAAKARQAAQDALTAAQAAQRQMSAQLAATQSALDAARLQLATLNRQRAQYIAWQKEQARIAAARRAAEERARRAAAAAAAAAARSGSWHTVAAPLAAAIGGSWSPAAGQTAVSRAMRYLGIPYAYAGGGYSGPSYGVCVSGDAWNDCHVYGLDCSGLSMYAWAPYLHMDHYAATQYSQAGSVHPSTSNLMPGDLVFWSSDGTEAGIHHVAIYVGGGNVIQAPHSGDIVRVTPLGEVDSGYFGATRPLS
jgi:cell wall-associated NlpC family hydrolase